MKYSKGPWQIQRIPDRDYISGELYQILDSDGATIATMNISETFLVQAGSRDTLVANANLICSAPELLESLKRICNCNAFGTDSLAAAEDQASEVIAHAEGRAK